LKRIYISFNTATSFKCPYTAIVLNHLSVVDYPDFVWRCRSAQTYIS